MKILIVLRNIGPYHNSRFESLLNSNIKLSVFETRPLSREYLWISNDNYKYDVYKFPMSSNVEVDIPNNDIDSFYKRYIPNIGPDVILSIGWADRTYQRLLLYGNKNKIPTIIVSDSIKKTEKNIKRPFLKELIKKIILKGYSSAFVAGTESKNYLLDLGFRNEKIFAPWDVIDNRFFAKYSTREISPHRKYFLCVSRLLKRKNLMNLIKSFSDYQIRGGKWGLKIIGSGDQYENLVKLSERVCNKSDFEIISWLQIDQLRKYYKEASAFILPSYFDNWGLVVNEAIASGLPCIVSKNCGCTVDLISNNKSGFIFDPFKKNELTKLMHKIENQTKEERAKMIRLAKINLEKFDLNNFVINLKKAINEAIRNPKYSLFSRIFLRITSLI
tara:strand:+ start:3318 stop:4481 length:1164 start_codon:yes stop_codon:yes gene_type:complete